MIQIQDLSKQYGSKVLFEHASARIGHRSRVALIGPNGAGKSTLIRLILGQESPDAGQITRAAHLAIGHLAQEVPKFSGRTVLEEAMRLDGRREELLAARAEAERGLEQTAASGEAAPELLERYGRLLEELEGLDEYRLESRAKAILGGMGFAEADFGRSLTEFSGGWLMRVALARILLMDPDLLLLDEPTNHLDLESLLWLEDFLRGFRGALLLVSHDTAFLNRMVSEVFEIDSRKVTAYRGNLDAWRVQKEERLRVLRAQYAGQQARIAEIEDFVRRFGAKATKATQAQSRLKELERMERIELPEDRSTVRFRFPPAPHSGREVVTARGAEMRFGEKVVFRDLDWVIRRGARVAIVGVNGAGKTTLLRMLAGELGPTAGEVKLGHQVSVGYYAQHQAESLDMRATVLQALERTAPTMPVAQVRAIAGAFLFSGDAVEKRCGVLSGGEKARVALAKLLLSPSNFLLLDEPTNHLDVESRAVLLEALRDYAGTLCLISHDREFIGPLVDTVLEISPKPGGSEVVQLVGTYEDYLARKLREAHEGRMRSDARDEKPRAGDVGPEAAPKKPAVSTNQRRSWERERDQAEADITRLERSAAGIAALLADAATYADPDRARKLSEEHGQIQRELEARLARWEELCARLG
jgi:ATP-binding cassette subfamily F protein 3